MHRLSLNFEVPWIWTHLQTPASGPIKIEVLWLETHPMVLKHNPDLSMPIYSSYKKKN